MAVNKADLLRDDPASALMLLRNERTTEQLSEIRAQIGSLAEQVREISNVKSEVGSMKIQMTQIQSEVGSLAGLLRDSGQAPALMGRFAVLEERGHQRDRRLAEIEEGEKRREEGEKKARLSMWLSFVGAGLAFASTALFWLISAAAGHAKVP